MFSSLRQNSCQTCTSYRRDNSHDFNLSSVRYQIKRSIKPTYRQFFSHSRETFCLFIIALKRNIHVSRKQIHVLHCKILQILKYLSHNVSILAVQYTPPFGKKICKNKSARVGLNKTTWHKQGIRIRLRMIFTLVQGKCIFGVFPVALVLNNPIDEFDAVFLKTSKVGKHWSHLAAKFTLNEMYTRN